MYFDYAILAFMIWGVGDALFGADKISDDSDEDTDTQSNPEVDNTSDGGDLLDETDSDSTDDVADDADYRYVSGPTVVTLETDGEVATSTFDDVDFGIAPTISGSEDADIITASDDTGFSMNIAAGAGEDQINFGFGATVDGGDDADTLSLSVTQNALASDSEAGEIDLTDSDDTLQITFQDETPEYVHTLRGQTTQTVDGVTTQTDWIDYYVSDDATLSGDDLTSAGSYDPADATRVFRAILGSGIGGDVLVNETPTIIVNRDIASAIDLRG